MALQQVSRLTSATWHTLLLDQARTGTVKSVHHAFSTLFAGGQGAAQPVNSLTYALALGRRVFAGACHAQATKCLEQE